MAAAEGTYYYERQRAKLPLCTKPYLALRAWVDFGASIEHLSFRRIVWFFEDGHGGDKDMLAQALAWIGVTYEEVVAMRLAGKTAKDLASEILTRGVRQDDGRCTRIHWTSASSCFFKYQMGPCRKSGNDGNCVI